MKYIKLFENFLDEYLIEDRRYIHDDLETQIINFLQKYKGKEDKIFVSFRSSEHVTMINRNNTKFTPLKLIIDLTVGSFFSIPPSTHVSPALNQSKATVKPRNIPKVATL